MPARAWGEWAAFLDVAGGRERHAEDQSVMWEAGHGSSFFLATKQQLVCPHERKSGTAENCGYGEGMDATPVPTPL